MIDNWIMAKATGTTYQPYTAARTNSDLLTAPTAVWTINSSMITSAAPFPMAAHPKDNFGAAIGTLLGLFLILAWAWPFSRLVRNLGMFLLLVGVCWLWFACADLSMVIGRKSPMCLNHRAFYRHIFRVKFTPCILQGPQENICLNIISLRLIAL
jgi:hypothetical protein